MTFFHAPLINAYQNLSNVMLRIQPRGWQSAVNDTLLLNAHYDSPIGSTGERPTVKLLSNCLVEYYEVERSARPPPLWWSCRKQFLNTSAPARLTAAQQRMIYNSACQSGWGCQSSWPHHFQVSSACGSLRCPVHVTGVQRMWRIAGVQYMCEVSSACG